MPVCAVERICVMAVVVVVDEWGAGEGECTTVVDVVIAASFAVLTVIVC
jgi:hypothetical protein